MNMLFVGVFWIALGLFVLGHCITMYPKTTTVELFLSCLLWPAYLGDEVSRYQIGLYPYGDVIDRHHPKFDVQPWSNN